jgi:molybdopterin converting factor small subunit
VARLLNSLALDVAPEHLMVVANRRRLEPDTVLEDGDEIDLFPPISGGTGQEFLSFIRETL